MYNLILLPAYGRRYETNSEALADWNAGKNFRIVAGPYTSKRDVFRLAERHHNVILSTCEGGAYVVKSLLVKRNALDSML